MDNTNMDVLLLRVKEEEDHWQQSQDHEVELFQTLRLQVEDLQKRLEEKDNKLIMASKVIRALKYEVQTLQQQLEQHRRKCHGDLNGQRGWPFQYGRGNDIITMPCVQAESVPSDCRASEPRSQDVTSQSSEPFFRVVEIEDFGMPPNVVLSCTAEGDPTNFWMSPVDDNLTTPQDLEDDPADFPLTLGYRTLSKVKSQKEPKLPVLSVMLQDCRDLLGPDGVLKMEIEEGEDEDDGDDLCYEDDEDDSDYDPKGDGFSPCSENKEVLSLAEELIAEPAGDQRRQKRGGTRIRTKTTLDKSHNKYRKCGKTFSYPSQKLSVRKGGYTRIKSITTAAPYDSSTVSPHENTSSNSAKTVSPQEEDNPANTRSEPYKAKAADLIQHPAVHPRRTSDIMEYYVPYECDVCGRTLSNKTNLAVHKRTHTGEKPYGCTECGQTFRASNSLRRHQRRQHLQTALPRRKRGRPKKVADDLRDSLRDYLHSGKPYACTQCDKTFKYRGSFLTHKAWHIGEKHHACTQCGKTFRFLSNLRDHLKKCHAQKRPFTESPNTGSCQEIGKSSTQSSSLNQNPTEKAPTTSIPESTSTDSCNTGSHQEVEGNDHANATPEPCKNNHTAQAKCKKLHSLKTDAKPAGLIQHPTVHPNGTYGEKGNNKRRYVPLECDVCGLMLANKRNLIVHKRIHTGEKPYVCTQCGKAFRSSSSFRAHQKSRHLLDGHLQTTLPLGKCARPRRKRGRPKKVADDLRDTLRDDLHSGERPYACTQCDKAFRSSSNLRQHQKRHHTQQRSSTESPNTGSSQEVGQASTHSNSLNQRPIDNPHGNTCTDYPDEEEGDNGITYEVPCECDICGKVIKRKRNLIIHKRMHTGEKPYACTQCGNTYRSKDALRIHQKRCHLQDRHLQIALPLRKRGRPKKGTGHLRDARHDHFHSGKRQYSCTLCDKTFKYRGSFLTHKAWHTGKKPYSCTQCGKTFRSASALRGHQKFHNHLQEKPSGTEKRENWKCDVCGIILANSRNLRIHSTLHTGERQYACTQCDKTFMYRTSLQNHQRSHHLQERPSLEYRRYEVTLKCDICERVFSNKSSLIVHKRRHTGEKPYACTLCEKTFRHQGTLKLHHRLHTKERPYKCSDCPMAWNSLGELKNHIRRKHTGEKPYACPLCPKTFYTASERSCHKKSHLG